MTKDEGKQKIVVIAGPTAGGKTSLAVELALALGGEIINADSMQVYRGMDIGTAKPTPQEQKGIIHHLLDVVGPDEEFNAAIYRDMVMPIIADILSRDKICFIVGGTGLYIKALLGGLFECPASDRELRNSLRLKCKQLGSRHLFEELKDMDPESASNIHPNDEMRIIRALEIIHLANQYPSDLYKGHGFEERPFHALKLFLKVDRDRLYKRIDERSVAMKDAGLIEETENLLKMGYSPDLKPMNAIGYRHMIKYLNGDWTLDKAMNTLQRDTRRYAKRQMTWFRADPETTWIAPEDFDRFLEEINGFLFKTE
ncbi:MAG: tRNA (adenosine(37)-N6)-dimethylallyltransferase MiaA [Desulfobacterales bacterium]|nr:tRNA (adenosine(37)-N6)-dimethylallyltransferase MiaA [Desulfobacterales bacterium]